MTKSHFCSNCGRPNVIPLKSGEKCDLCKPGAMETITFDKLGKSAVSRAMRTILSDRNIYWYDGRWQTQEMIELSNVYNPDPPHMEQNAQSVTPPA